MNARERDRLVKQAVETGQWMIRTDDGEGGAYRGFQWAGVGAWTEAPDWNDRPECGGGLHGQGPAGSGELATDRRARLLFCLTDGPVVGIGGDKQKVRRAMILLVNELPPDNLSVGWSLDLIGCPMGDGYIDALTEKGYAVIR